MTATLRRPPLVDAEKFTAAKSVKANANGAYSFLESISSTTKFYVESAGVRSSTATASVKDRVGLTLKGGTEAVSASVTTNPAVHGWRCGSRR